MSSTESEPSEEFIKRGLHPDHPEYVSLEEMLCTGATYRKLDYWVRRGYLKPENSGKGSGTWRYWTRRDHQIATALVRLSKVLVFEHALTVAERYVDEGVTEFEFDYVTITLPHHPERNDDGNA